MKLHSWVKRNIPDDWERETIHTDSPETTFIVVFSDPNRVRAYIVWVKPIKGRDGKIKNIVDAVVDGAYQNDLQRR